MLQILKVENREKVFDTTLAEYLINPLKGAYTCEETAKEYLNLTIKTRQEYLGKKTNEAALAEEEEAFVQYACYQVYVCLQAEQILMDKLTTEGMEHLYREIELPLVYTLSDMEKEGIAIKAEALKEYGNNLTGQIEILEKNIYELADRKSTRLNSSHL